MSDSRKLLPYEHQLIDALGITKEEYLAFVAQQHIYEDVKEGTVLDARNWEVVAIVLTVVGVLFQVAAVLLAPKPSAPDVKGGGQAGTRDEIFAPRYGFNSSQNLARYGDPVNLVYANTDVNPNGGVRVGTSLIWSAVQSYGGSQLAQLLFVIGAGGIGAIDPKRTAFGQTPFRDLVNQNYWLYFRPDSTGQLWNSNVLPDFYGGQKINDPTRFGNPSDNPFRIRQPGAANKLDGFSHSYSPSSANQFGVYGIVPINVDILIRNANGDFEGANNRIGLNINRVWGTFNRSGGQLAKISNGSPCDIQLFAISSQGDSLAELEAKESRRSIASIFDSAGVFKAGSLQIKIETIKNNNIEKENLFATARTINDGVAPSIAYQTTRSEQIDINARLPELAREYEAVSRWYEQNIASRDNGPVGTLSIGQSTERSTPQEILNRGYITRLVRSTDTRELKQGTVSTTTFSVVKDRDLTWQDKQLLNDYINLKGQVESSSVKDDFFGVKVLAKIEEASYETVSKCNIVDFSIRAKVYRRISGRQSEYGSERRQGWSISDNGIKHRSAMFLIKYKPSGVDNASFVYFPGIFVIRRAADNDSYVFLRFNSGTRGENAASHWQFKFEPVVDPLAEFAAHPELTERGQRYYYYLENSGALAIKDIGNGRSLEYTGYRQAAGLGGFPPVNASPGGTNEWDLFSVSSDTQYQFSFDQGPEMAIANVTEQIVEPFVPDSGLYANLSLFGLTMYAGKTIQDLRNLTIYVTKGRRTRTLITSGNGWGSDSFNYLSPSANDYACTAPDIFIDTVLDGIDGIGRYASVYSTDLKQLAISKKFCLANKFFMEGVIAEPSSWREFWATTAGFSLLELAKIGGQDVLVPAVPYDKNTGNISSSIAISALFNQGNILEDSYKEEFIDYGSNSQDVIVRVLYRKLDRDGVFATNDSVSVSLADTSESFATQETVDASNFVSSRDQAIAIGKLLCLSKRYSRRAIEFKTFPTDSPVFPGAYIYVELAHNSWDRIYSGIIEENGILNAPSSIPDGTYAALTYKHGTNVSIDQPSGTIYHESIRVTTSNDGTKISSELSGASGSLFVLGNAVRNKRVFRVTEVNMDEEGEVTIRGVEHATDANGFSQIGLGMLSNSIWRIE